MKKNAKSKSPAGPEEKAPDIMAVINRIDQRLANLERKIDALPGQQRHVSAQAQAERKPEVKFYQRFERPQQPNGQDPRRNDFRERVLHKAVCADCNKSCEVPFKPAGDRPVYCKDCFSKRKSPAAPFAVNKPPSSAPEAKISNAAVSPERDRRPGPKTAGRKKVTIKKKKRS